MVDTRRSKANFVVVMKPEDLPAKDNSSKSTSETIELPELFVALFSTLQLEFDTKIKSIDERVTELDNKNKALQDEKNNIKQITEH